MVALGFGFLVLGFFDFFGAGGFGCTTGRDVTLGRVVLAMRALALVEAGAGEATAGAAVPVAVRAT